DDLVTGVQTCALPILTITGVVLAIWLLGLWAGRTAGASASTGLLVILPLALLALAALDVIRGRDYGINWGRGIVVALCALLTVRSEERRVGDVCMSGR